MTHFWGGITVAGYLLTLFLVPSVILNKNKSAVSAVAWILAILLLPFFGSLLYVVFGINRVARRAGLKKAARRQLEQRLPELSQYQLIPGEALDKQTETLTRLANRIYTTRPTFANQIELIRDTNRTFALIEQSVRAATESLHLEYYIWQPDRTGLRLRDLLIERARSGVKVRFLYDGLGSWFLGRKFLQPMRDAGIETATFLPGQTWRERWSINLRSHRKIVVADGRVGFTGGMNIGDEYLGKDKTLGFWRDTHLRLMGPAVLQLQQVFAEDWYFATGQALTDKELYPEPRDMGEQVAQVLASGPDADNAVFHALYFAAINEARQRVTIATSYFVPTEAIVSALETAALRGVKVRLLLPRKAAHLSTVFASRSYYETLLRSGVEIYEYMKGQLHSKTITIDGNWSLVGTANLDARSLLLNFEVGLVVYDPRMAAQLEEHFDADLQDAERVELSAWILRPVTQVLVENVCRLFSPVL